MNQPRFVRKVFVSVLIYLLILPSLHNSASFAEVQSQESCKKELIDAENNYRDGRFDEAIKILVGCLTKRDAKEHEKALAYKLLGKVYLSKNYLSQAREAINKMLDVNPDIVLDRQQEPPPLIALFEEVKKEREKEKPPVGFKTIEEKRQGSSKKWLWIGVGGGVVAVGVIAFLASGGNGNGGTGTLIITVPDPGNSGN